MSELVDCINNLSAKDIIRAIAKTANGMPFYLTVDGGDPCADYANLIDNSGVLMGGVLCDTDWVDTNTDGIADGWTAVGLSAQSIVTGNGFSGNAQRFEHTSGTTTRPYFATGINAEIGETYRVSGKFRAGATLWRCYLRGTSDAFTSNMGVNAGNAIAFQYDFNATGATEIRLSFYKVSALANDYIEIDEVLLIKL